MKSGIYSIELHNVGRVVQQWLSAFQRDWESGSHLVYKNGHLNNAHLVGQFANLTWLSQVCPNVIGSPEREHMKK